MTATRQSTILDAYGRNLPRLNGKPRRELAEHVARVRPQRQIAASYDAASDSDEYSNYWAASDALDADSANSKAVREKLVRRSRYEVGSNGFADGIAATWTTDLIGKGPSLRMQTKSDGFNQMVENAWYFWCKEIKFRRKLWCMAHALHVDGEGIGVIRRNAGLKHPVKVDLRLYETEQCQTPMLPYSEPGYIDGIKFDEGGNPVWYDILKEHPGNSNRILLDLTPERVPARFVCHWFKLRRPGQHRGVPHTTSTLNLGAASRRFREAVLAAGETAADFAVLLETMFEPDELDAASPFSTLEIQKRMMTALPNSVKATQLRAEHPNTTYDSFRKSLVNEQARPVSMPYNKAACDSSSYNYASGRLDHQTYYAALDVDRQDCNDLVLDPLFGTWFDLAVVFYGWLGGNPEAISPMAKAHLWDWPKHRVADVTSEATANDKQLKNGSKSLAVIYTEAGEDYEDEVEKQAASNGITVEQQKQINLLLNLPQHVLPTVERLLGLAPEPEPVVVPTELDEDVEARQVIVNVNAYDPNQPRDDVGRFGSGGGGGGSTSSGGGGSGAFDEEQRQADREVKRANTAVKKAETALSSAEAKGAVKRGKVKVLQSKLSSVQNRIADLEAQKAASAARIAALRSQLKGEFHASVETDLAKEQKRFDEITKQLADVANEAERLASEVDELAKEIERENKTDEKA